MRQVLFFIGCFLFFIGLAIFVLVLLFASNDGLALAKDKVNFNVYILTILFFVGTYLISNNKPEDK